MTRSIARKLLLSVTALCALTWLAEPVDAGVRNKSYGVQVTRSGATFEDCFSFFGANQFSSSVGLSGTWSEFDLFFFGFWSFQASNDIRFSGFQVFGVWIFGSGRNTIGESFYAYGSEGCFFAPREPERDAPGDSWYAASATFAHRAREFDPRLWR